MIRYKTRPGVVLTSVCGQPLLVAAKKLQDRCPYVTELNETSAFLWERLRCGADLNGLMAALGEEYELDDPNTAKVAVEAFLRQMLELNYLLPEEQGDDHEE